MPFPVDDDALADARAAFEETLIEGHCVIKQPGAGTVPVVGGGVAQGTGGAGTTVRTEACRVERGAGNEVLYAQRTGGRAAYTVYMRHMANPADRPKLDQWIDTDDGLRLEIIDVIAGYDGAFSTEIVAVQRKGV